MVGSLVRRLGARGQTEDELQGLFTHLLEVLPRFRAEGPAALTTWVHTVAQRWLLMQRRRSEPTLVALEGGLEVADAAQPADVAVQGRQLSQLLESALSRLPDEQRRAFVLTAIHLRTLESVAEAESVPVGTIKSRLHRARVALVLALGPALDRPSPTGASRAG